MSDVRQDVITPNDMFWRVLAAHRKEPVQSLRDHYFKRRILGLDPGETTGIAFWDGERITLSQLETKDIGHSYEALKDAIILYNVDHIRCEEYRVYNWMADSHAWSVLHTPQLIGAIKVLAQNLGIPLSFKLAQHAKSTWNDNVLEKCGLYNKGLKHARDASRHLLYYMTQPDLAD